MPWGKCEANQHTVDGGWIDNSGKDWSFGRFASFAGGAMPTALGMGMESVSSIQFM